MGFLRPVCLGWEFEPWSGYNYFRRDYPFTTSTWERSGRVLDCI